MVHFMLLGTNNTKFGIDENSRSYQFLAIGVTHTIQKLEMWHGRLMVIMGQRVKMWPTVKKDNLVQLLNQVIRCQQQTKYISNNYLSTGYILQ